MKPPWPTATTLWPACSSWPKNAIPVSPASAPSWKKSCRAFPPRNRPRCSPRSPASRKAAWRASSVPAMTRWACAATSPPVPTKCAPGPSTRAGRLPRLPGVIHTDFERGFIRAEVISYADYMSHESEAACAPRRRAARGRQGIRGAGRRRHALPVQRLVAATGLRASRGTATAVAFFMPPGQHGQKHSRLLPVTRMPPCPLLCLSIILCDDWTIFSVDLIFPPHCGRARFVP